MMTLAADPLVSLIVLCYNQAQFVVETLESVKAQTYKTTQLIIVDDCSTDGSVAIIERWLKENGIDCTFIRHQQNYGLCKTVNDALAAASGKYISMVASDDIWLPDKIERQVKIMESQPEHVAVLYSDAFQIDENGHPLPDTFVPPSRRLIKMPEDQILNMLLEYNFIPAVTTLIRRSCYEQVGLYDENLPWEDWDMWMRIARHYSFIYSPIASARYRRHQRSITHSDASRMMKDSFKVCYKQFSFGDLKEGQKSTLTRTLLAWSEQLYSQNDGDTSDLLLALWRVTGNARAHWMYLFTKLGISYKNWLRANHLRRRFQSIRGVFGGSHIVPEKP